MSRSYMQQAVTMHTAYSAGSHRNSVSITESLLDGVD